MDGPRFEALSVGEILDRVFLLYRRYFARFLAIAGVTQVPLGLASVFFAALPFMVMAVPGAREFPEELEVQVVVFMLGWLGGAATFLLALVAGQVSAAAMLTCMSGAYLGRDVTFGQAYRFALRRIGWILLAILLVGLALVAILAGFAYVMIRGVLALQSSLPMEIAETAVPAFVIAALVALAAAYLVLATFSVPIMPVILVENANTIRAIGRSVALVRRNFWRALAVVLVALLVVWVMRACFLTVGLVLLALFMDSGKLVAGQVLYQSVNMVAPILAMPIMAGAGILLYYDMRIRREGLDLEMLAARP